MVRFPRLSYVPSSYQPMALLGTLKAAERDQIVEQSRRDYEALRKSEFDRRHWSDKRRPRR